MESRPQLKVKVDWTWLVIAIGLYVLSTIGLANGSGAGLVYGIEGATEDAYTISQTTAIILGWLVAIVIQLYETKVLINWKQEDEFEKTVAKVMFALDFLAICIALGVHMNIIWMAENHTNVPGMIVHLFGLFVELFIAFLGSIVAEMAFAKAIGSLENLPQIGVDIMAMIKRHSSRRAERSSRPGGSGQWQPLPAEEAITRVLRGIAGQPENILVQGVDGNLYIAPRTDSRVITKLKTQ